MKRPVPQIRTDLEFAPTDTSRLAQMLGGFACSRDIQCGIQNCHTDRHHLIFDSQYADPLSEGEQLLKSLPENIERVCRWKHMRVHATWDRSEPIDNVTAVEIFAKSTLPGGNQGRRIQNFIGRVE